MSPDIVNSLFEAGGALMMIENCRVLLRDKRVAGVSLVGSAFFTTWGGWNLFYYAHLDQWHSWAAGMAMFASNAVWLAMAVYYRRVKQ